MVEITDESSARAWLETQSRAICIVLSARTVLRGAGVMSLRDGASLGELALPTFRAMLTIGIEGVASGQDTKEAARLACNAAGQATGFEFDANVDYPNHAAYCAAHAVYDAVSGAAGFDSGVGISATHAAHLTADAAERAARIGSTEAPDSNSGLSARTVYLALSRDAERIEAGEAAGTMFRHPVWRDVGEPTAVADARGKLLAFLGKSSL